jgi:hypothetical protein
MVGCATCCTRGNFIFVSQVHVCKKLQFAHPTSIMNPGRLDQEREIMASKSSLINRTECRKFALRWARDHRKGWTTNRVSKQFLDDLEAKVRIMIQSAIKRHPSVGQTIKDLS